MKGPWKVTSTLVGDVMMYAVYRLIDENEVDHSGNRHQATGWYEDYDFAVKVAQKLNAKSQVET